VLTIVAIVLAVLVLPSPWGWIAVLVGALIDILETLVFWWWSKRRRPTVGVETLVGAEAEVVDGRYVRVAGELWRARDLGGRAPGERVRVRAVDGLELDVE
jgi:membrane protein implicated in regulation of membrane protease activity